MARWIPVARPRAELTQVDADEVAEKDGRKTTLFRTDHGVMFMRITEQNGFTYWIQRVDR